MVIFMVCRLVIPVLKVWSLDQLHQRQLETCEKCKFSGLTPELSETSGEGPSNLCFHKSPR